jgi:hypothetical protein
MPGATLPCSNRDRLVDWRRFGILRRFLGHLARFSTLPAAVLLACELVLVGSGEAWPVDRVLAFQRQRPDSRFLRALDQVFYNFKYRAIDQRRPSVVVLGSSRTMKFRAGMFGDRADGFFNAGGMINSMADLHAFCFTRPPARTPDAIILGVDLWWLNGQVEPVFRFEQEIDRDRARTFDQHIIGARWLLRHPTMLGRELATLATRRQPNAIGLGAREGRGGFRVDGSFASAVPVPRPGEPFIDREEPPIIDRVKTATANFVPTDRVDPDRLATLIAVLDAYRQQQRLVIGYLPPFSTAVAGQLRSDPRQSAFFAEFRRVVPALFAAREFPLVDASELGDFGTDDRVMSDGFHGEETIHAHVVQMMLRDQRVRDAFRGADAVLERALASPRTNDWQVDLPPR